MMQWSHGIKGKVIILEAVVRSLSHVMVSTWVLHTASFIKEELGQTYVSHRRDTESKHISSVEGELVHTFLTCHIEVCRQPAFDKKVDTSEGPMR